MRYLTVVRLPCFFILFFYLTLAGSLPRAFADKVAKKGDNVSIEYEGSLNDGTVFDSSKNHDKPFQFVVGSGQVISEFNKAVLGMRLMMGGRSGENLRRAVITEVTKEYIVIDMNHPLTGEALTFAINLIKISN